MRTKKIKIIALALGSILLFSACGQTQSSTSSANKESGQASASASSQSTVASSEASVVPSYFNETGYPIVNEEITIKVLALKHASSVDFDNLADSPAWKYISELTGIKFEFEEYLKEDLATKMPLIMADPGSRPDIFWRVNEADKNIGSYADQGMFLDLESYLEYMPNLQAAWASDPSYEYAARSVGGQIYTLPSYAFAYDPWSFVVNDRWMENCGIKSYPTNLEEFKEMLIKFRDMDANGNGDPNDEIPLKGNLTQIPVILSNAMGLLAYNPTTGVMYSVDEGEKEVYPVFMDERYRAMVEYFAELYREGLVNSDMFTVDTVEDKARQDADIYGVFTGVSGIKRNGENTDEYTTLPLLTSDYLSANAEGIVDKGIVPPVYLNDVAMISANTKYPEVCARLLDWFYSMDAAALYSCKDPANYDMEAAGVSPEVIEMLETNWARTDKNSPIFNIHGYYGPRWERQFEVYQYEDVFKNNIQISNYNNLRVNYADKGQLRTCFTNVLKFTSEENDVITQYQTDIDIYVKEKLSSWIIDAEVLNDDTWAAYLKQLKAMNVDAMTAAYQTAYDRMASTQ